jgi:hypothetical protein
MEWKDRSSFSQGDKVRTPKTFEALAGGLQITVTRHIHHEPTDWVLICEPFFANTVIGNGTADDAKSAALDSVRAKLRAALDALTPNA